jgi:hypothetical protein
MIPSTLLLFPHVQSASSKCCYANPQSNTFQGDTFIVIRQHEEFVLTRIHKALHHLRLYQQKRPRFPDHFHLQLLVGHLGRLCAQQIE